MDKETIRDYLEKSEFSEVQADTLARLLSQTVARDDLRLGVVELENALANRISALEKTIESRTGALERKLESFVGAVDKKIDSKTSTLEHEIANRSNALDVKIVSLQSEIKESTARLERNIARVHSDIAKWAVTLLVAMGALLAMFDLVIN